MATGDLISAADYNNIRNKIIGIIGPGSGQSGYGQIIQSSAVTADSIISKAQWDRLRYDIYNALIHQTGSVPSINEVTQNSVIRYGASHPVFQYDTLADQAITNKFNIGGGRFAIEAGTVASRTTAWTAAVSTTVTVTFSTADQARYFFNSGGKLTLASSRTGGSSTAQNDSWSNLLSAAGIRTFDAISSTINFYNLTNVDQLLYSTTASIPYAANSYQIRVRGDVANNSAGGARIITFTVSWSDPYVDSDPSNPPPDQIDGTLSLTVEQYRATGPVLPSGNFTITGPSYTNSGITGS